MTTRFSRVLPLAVAAALATGCGSIGQDTVSPDRSGYADAIATSWKEQMLLNLVKMKYGDVPVFLDVNSVIASYTFEGRGGGTLNWDPTNARSTGALIGGTYQDKPTITYVPLTGEKFTKALLTPIPPSTIFSMVQAGWPVSGVFGMAVRSVNGVRNRSLGMNPEPEDPAWGRLIEAWSAVQDSGTVDLRVQKNADGESIVIVIGTPKDESVARHAKAIRDILGITTETREFALAFGSQPSRPGEIAVLSRSLFEIFLEISATVEVDSEDAAKGRVLPLSDPAAEPMIAIRSSASRPEDAAVATQYRGRWFYVRDDDFRSKVRLMFLFFIHAMLESGSKGSAAPLLTISN